MTAQRNVYRKLEQDMLMQAERPVGAQCSVAAYLPPCEASLGHGARVLLDWVAQCWKRNQGRLVISGSGQEGVSEEYNLALGDRRARAAEQHLRSQGVAARAISILSGSESPAEFRPEDNGKVDVRHIPEAGADPPATSPIQQTGHTAD